MKRDSGQETWTRAKEERVRRENEKKHRARILRAAERKQPSAPAREFDLSRIMNEANSTDEETLARAVRNLCPCRIGWDGFQQGMEVIAQRQKDASPEVRRQALHVIEDAFGMQSQESRKADREARDLAEEDAAKRERQQERQIKKEAARAFGSGVQGSGSKRRQMGGRVRGFSTAGTKAKAGAAEMVLDGALVPTTPAAVLPGRGARWNRDRHRRRGTIKRLYGPVRRVSCLSHGQSPQGGQQERQS